MACIGAVLALTACTAALAADPAAPAAAPAAPEKITGPLTMAEAQTEPFSWSASLSPSGRYLAVARRKDQLDYLLIADLQDETVKPFTYPVPYGGVRWVTWVTDDRLLFAAEFLVSREGTPSTLFRNHTGHDNGNALRLIAIDRDGKNMAMLFAKNAEALNTVNLTHASLLRNDPKHVVAPAWENGRYSLFLVDIDTGASQVIAKGNPYTFRWFADLDGHPAFRLDRNLLDTVAQVYARKGPADAAPGDVDWDLITTYRLRDEDYKASPEFFPVGPGPDANTYYVSARPDGVDASEVYLYDFAAKKYLKTVAAEPGIDIEAVITGKNDGVFHGSMFYADHHVTRRVDPKDQATVDALQKYFGDEVDVYVEDYVQGTWLIYTTGPRDPGSWHVYREKDKNVRELVRALPLDPSRLGTGKVVHYKARDGLDIMGYLTLPPNAKPGVPPPLVMFPHGGPEDRDTAGFDPFVQLLASRGYAVFQPNFRGSSGFGKKFADAGKRHWGTAMQDDLTDGFEYLVKNGFAAHGRACIVGFSYGGYAALAAATQTPDLYRCAVSYAGISDLPEFLTYKKRARGAMSELWTYMKRQVGDPDTDEAMLVAHSPDRLAAAVTAPVLLLHGKEDKNVPREQSELMANALGKAGKQVELIEIENTHHIPAREGWQQIGNAVIAFLEKNLPVDAPAPVAASAPAAPTASAQ